MARRPKAPLKEGDIEIELSSDDPIIPVVNDTQDDPPPQKEAKKPNGGAQDIEPPVQDDDSAALRKQLEDLRRAEESSRQAAADAEQRFQEANRRAQELEQQRSQSQTQQLEAEYDSVLNAISASQSEADAAQAAYEKAAEMGDYKAMGDAQRKISRAEARLESLESGKSQIEWRREEAKRAPRPEVQQDPFEAYLTQQQFPDGVKTWLRSHREFLSDQRKNAKLQNAHWEAMDTGATYGSPEYIGAVEEALGLRQKKEPTIDDDDEPEPPARRAPVSAPVSRDVASPSTGRAVNQRVTLSAEERETAHLSMPGMDHAEAEKVYAREKLRLQKLKAEGHYQER